MHARRPARAARTFVAGVCVTLAIAATCSVSHDASAQWGRGGGLEIVGGDGRSWDAILREIQSDPATAGRSYALAVRSRGSVVGCGEYELTLDPVAGQAFALDGCDVTTSMTRLRVVERTVLFTPGDIVPQPRSVSIHAALRQSATAWGGGDTPSAGSKIWCSVALQPYLWDGLRGVPAPLEPDRFELRPLDRHIHAAPDGSGWIAHGESRMTVTFHYDVLDRATGAKVLEDVATLACADGPVTPEPPVALFPLEHEAPWVSSHDGEKPPPSSPEHLPVAIDLRIMPAGAIFGASDIQMEMLGVQLGVGKYLSERWYVGGAARWAMELDMGGAGGMNNVFQLGPEARYVFHIGKGSMRSNGGPARPIPYVDWLGLRAGLEDVGPGNANGGFAEVSWGSEFRAGMTAFGTVFAVGTGIDGAGAYGDASVLHPYVDFALRFGLNL